MEANVSPPNSFLESNAAVIQGRGRDCLSDNASQQGPLVIETVYRRERPCVVTNDFAVFPPSEGIRFAALRLT